MSESGERRRTLLYTVGVPGAGKTTAWRRALAGLAGWQMEEPVPHVLYADGFVQLGRADREHAGTDALRYNAKWDVLAWMRQTPQLEVVLAEGDRLAEDGFFGAVSESGWTVEVVHLSVSRETAEQRREQRGSRQDESWLKGRRTKVERLAEAWNAREVDAEQGPDAVAEELGKLETVERVRQAHERFRQRMGMDTAEDEKRASRELTARTEAATTGGG